MRIRYRLQSDDLIAFSRRQALHSRSGRRKTFHSRLLNAIFIFIGMMLLAAWVYSRNSNGSLMSNVVLVLIGFVTPIAWFVIWPIQLRQRIDARARIGFKRNEERFGGSHELEIVDRDLVHRDPVSETRTRLSEILDFENEEGRTYIFMNPVSAYIIPHGSVTEGDLSAFLRLLEERRAAKRDEIVASK